MLAFCYSINGDLAMLLRRCGLLSKMIINHDLKIITRNPRASLNPIQEELLTTIGKILTTYEKQTVSNPNRMFLY